MLKDAFINTNMFLQHYLHFDTSKTIRFCSLVVGLKILLSIFTYEKRNVQWVRPSQKEGI